MLLAGILLGLVLGLFAGGRISNLGTVRLRWVGFLFAAVVVRFTIETGLGANLTPAEFLRLPLFVLAYGMLLAGLWVNRGQPGMSLAFVGVLGNAAELLSPETVDGALVGGASLEPGDFLKIAAASS